MVKDLASIINQSKRTAVQSLTGDKQYCALDKSLCYGLDLAVTMDNFRENKHYKAINMNIHIS